MYRIGIVSGDRGMQSYMVDALLRISIKIDREFKVQIFSAYEELMDYYRNENPNIHILIADMITKDTISNKAISNIRSVYDADFKLLLVTMDMETIVENLGIQPFEYLVQPLSYKKLREKMTKLCRDIDRAKEQYVLINSSGEDVILRYSDIILIESAKELSSKGKLEVETTSGRYLASGRLSDYAERLRNHYFLRIHRSYLVNLDYINRFKKSSIVLKDERELPIGRTKQKDIKEMCSRFVL